MQFTRKRLLEVVNALITYNAEHGTSYILENEKVVNFARAVNDLIILERSVWDARFPKSEKVVK